MQLPITTEENVRSYVDYSYDTEYHCEEYGCDSICRCGTLHNLKVTGISSGMLEVFNLAHKPLDPLMEYLFDQIFYYGKCPMDTDCFEFKVEPSYYGEEVEAVYFYDDHDIGVMYGLLKKFMDASDIERVKWALEREYGFLTDEVKRCSQVEVKKLSLKRINRAKPLKRPEYRAWHGTKKYFIAGVVIPDGNGYKLVDGNHRYASGIKQDGDKAKGNYIVIS